MASKPGNRLCENLQLSHKNSMILLSFDTTQCSFVSAQRLYLHSSQATISATLKYNVNMFNFGMF